MTSKDKIIIGMSVLLIAESALLFFAWKNAQKKPLERIEYVDRVITKTDTVKVLEPKEIVRERLVTDTMLIPVVDTLRFTDTLFVQVERESRTYEGEEYRAVVSGYQPALDAIDIYKRTEYVEVRKPCRWGIGLQAGYGIGLQGNPCFVPYVGIGISYNIISW